MRHLLHHDACLALPPSISYKQIPNPLKFKNCQRSKPPFCTQQKPSKESLPEGADSWYPQWRPQKALPEGAASPYAIVGRIGGKKIGLKEIEQQAALSEGARQALNAA